MARLAPEKMPPRFAYWTIILDGAPTAFRAKDRETLLPTFHQLKTKNPDAIMRWFAHGKLWDSPEQARAARSRAGRERPRKPHARPREERRGAEWRPGGQHGDPRARFKVPRDVRRARFSQRRREGGQVQRFEGQPRKSGRKPTPARRPARHEGQEPYPRPLPPTRPAGPGRPPKPGEEPKPGTTPPPEEIRIVPEHPERGRPHGNRPRPRRFKRR